MSRYYLEQIDKQDFFDVDRKDRRYNDWVKNKEQYGFYPQECWDLNEAMLLLLYERIRFFKQESGEVIDLNFHKFSYQGEVKTQLQLIDKIIDNCEKIFKNDNVTMEDFAEKSDLTTEVWEIWSVISAAMWW